MEKTWLGRWCHVRGPRLHVRQHLKPNDTKVSQTSSGLRAKPICEVFVCVRPPPPPLVEVGKTIIRKDRYLEKINNLIKQPVCLVRRSSVLYFVPIRECASLSIRLFNLFFQSKLKKKKTKSITKANELDDKNMPAFDR